MASQLQLFYHQYLSCIVLSVYNINLFSEFRMLDLAK